MVSNKLHKKIKLFLDKKINDKLNITNFFNLLDVLGFDRYESREIYSYYLTKGTSKSILPWEWLDIYFKDFELLNHSNPKEHVLIVRKDFDTSLSVNITEKEITIVDKRILKGFTDYFCIPQKETIEYIKRWLPITKIYPFPYFVDFTIKTLHINSLYGEPNFFRNHILINGRYGMGIDPAIQYRDYNEYNFFVERNNQRQFFYPSYEERPIKININQY